MSKDIQSQLLTRIVERYTKRVDAVDALSKLLNIGRDAVYRRLRGDTLLTPEEIKKICQNYQISMDSYIFNESNTVFFVFNAFTQKITSISDYLNSLKAQIDALKSMNDIQVYYASSEIPIFYYCFFPQLISFKFYVWGRTIWDLDYMRQSPFKLDMIPPHAIELSKDVLNGYLNLYSTELWSINFFDNTLNQIEYHLISGQFADPQDSLTLCGYLKELAQQMRHMAEHGKKFRLKGDPTSGKDFQLYHNEMIYTNNTIMAKSEEHNVRAVYTTFANPNFLRSTDRRIFDFTEQWFDKVIRKGSSISKEGERERNRFFRDIIRKIEFKEKSLKNYIELE